MAYRSSEGLLTMRPAAQHVGVSEMTLRNRIATGKLVPTATVQTPSGRVVKLFSTDDLDAHFEEFPLRESPAWSRCQ